MAKAKPPSIASLDARIRRLERAVERLTAPKRSTVWTQRNEALQACAEWAYGFLFDEPWPSHISVVWAPRLHNGSGSSDHAAIHLRRGGKRKVALDWNYAQRKPHYALPILIHEFGHIRGFVHGRKFREAIDGWSERLGIEPFY